MAREPLVSRTQEKLQYARLQLDELKNLPQWDPAQPFVRAHEESVLYHTIGARDAFLHEVNDAYGLGLDLDEVSLKAIRTRLQARKIKSRAFEEVYKLSHRNPKKRWSWLAMAIEIRDHGTHRARPPRAYYVGGPLDGTVRFLSPRYKRTISQDIPSFLDTTLEKTEKLIRRLRRTLPV